MVTGKGALALGLLAGPVAWFAHLNVSYVLVPWICDGGPGWALHVVTVAASLLAGSGAGVALAAYRGAGGTESRTRWLDPPVGHGTSDWSRPGALRADARSLVSLTGLLLSAFFLFLILAEGLPTLLRDDLCGGVPTLDRPIIMSNATALTAGFPALGMLHPDGLVGPGEWWSAWNPDLWITGTLLGLTSFYVRGVRRLWARAGRGRGVARWRVAAYLGGIATLVVALLSPVDGLGETLFSVHMTQHMLLMVVAAPLLILGNPSLAFVWALPANGRRAFAMRWRGARTARAAWRGLSHPLSIFVLHVGALWIWHVPQLYEAALANRAMHATEHASFLFTAMLFWWALARAGRRGRWPGYGAAVLYVFATALQSGALGALLLFSPVPLYDAHAEGAALWGIDLIIDQQIAAALMWVPAGVVYSAAALVLFFAWLRSADQAATRRDGAGWISLGTQRF